MMSAKYFEYYTIILRGAVFSWTRCTSRTKLGIFGITRAGSFFTGWMPFISLTQCLRTEGTQNNDASEGKSPNGPYLS